MESGYNVLHLASVGGWNQPHPEGIAAPEAFAAFDVWNREVVADSVITGFQGFDGVHWDIEGADSVASPMNQMSAGVLDLIGGFAALCQRNGYFSTLSAPESYLDPFSNSFDRSLTHTYPKWAQIGVDFSYHGRNCLAYVLAAYGGAMDLVSFQLYETYSHADFAVNVRGLDAGPYLARYVDALSRGWLMDFTQDHALAAADRFGGLGSGLRTVGVARSKIVLGLANAWGGRGDPVRALYLSPHQLLLAHRRLLAWGLAPRGYMLWSLGSERKKPVDSDAPLNLAWWFADILGTL